MKTILRIIKILYIIKKYNLLNLIINKKYNFVNLISKLINKEIQKKNDGERLKNAFEELGPIFIKVGQLLSLRIDIIPIKIINELKKLQTNITPFNTNIAKNIIENKLNIKIKDLFYKFNENPLASASIAQIHSAILKNREKVIVKILKPGINKNINLDLFILKNISKIINIIPKFKRLKIPEIINEINKTIQNELNFKIEATNSVKLNQKSDNLNLQIPKIYWEHTNEEILIMEYMDGINITNLKELEKYNFNIYNISKKLIEISYYQIFKNQFFHADLHPGNILISKNKENITIILLDFGIVSSISKTEKNYLLNNMLAFSKRNYKKVAKLHIKSKSMIVKNNIQDLEREICFIFEPILNKPIENISFKKTIKSLFFLSKKFKMQLQPKLILFQKTLLTLDGLIRNICPNFNIWKVTRKTLEKIIISKNIKNIISKNLIKQLNKITKKNDTKYQKIYFSFFDKSFIFIMGYIFATLIFIIITKLEINII